MATDSFFRARWALTPDGWQSDVLIHVVDGCIASLEPLDGRPAPRRFECNCIVPGAINVHSHAFQRLLVGRTGAFRSPDDDFWAWRHIMYAEAARLTPDTLHDTYLGVFKAMRAAGTTTITEFHYVHGADQGVDVPVRMGRAVQQAAKDAGVRLLLLPVLYRFGGFGGRPATSEQAPFLLDTRVYLELMDSLADGYGSIGYAPHSLRAVSESDIERALDQRKLDRPDAPVHIHVAEQMREVNECMIALRKRPVEYVLERFHADASWCFIHATHMTDAERTKLASKGVTVGLCPTTEADLGDGRFPLRPFLSDGGHIAIGSDSNVCLDVASELRLLDYQQRLETRRRNAFQLNSATPVARWLYEHMLTGGRRATGLPVGRLEPGAPADFVDLPGDGPPDDVLGAWIHGDGVRPVQVFVDGRMA